MKVEKSYSKQLSKKKYFKKKGRIGVDIHREGKFYCNCLTRNFRKWLGKKRYGVIDGF